MPDERVIQQVNGILGMNNVNFQMDDSKTTFLVPAGTTGVMIDFADWGENTIVGLRSIVLAQVDGSGERKQKILEALNEKNRQVPFGCFYFDPDDGMVILDYHLLADQLQAPELMNALGFIGSLADQVDEELRDAIGSGVRTSDAVGAAQANASEPENAGPVVNT